MLLRSLNQINPWRVMAKTRRFGPTSPVGRTTSPEHDDVVQKADGRSLAASKRSTAGWGSLQGASGRCHAKTAQRARRAVEAMFRWYVKSAFPLRIVRRCTSEGDVQASRYKKAVFMVGNFGPGVHSAISGYDAPSHMHPVVQTTEQIPAAVSPYFPSSC
jgi:hypothetical protein